MVGRRPVRRGDAVFARRHLAKGKLHLLVKRDGLDCAIVDAEDGSTIFFDDEEKVRAFCREYGLELRVTESNLKPGDTVIVRMHASGRPCLMIEKDGREHTVFRDDGRSVRLFDALGEVRLDCIKRELRLLIPDDWDTPGKPRAASRHHHIPNREEPSFALDPEVEKEICQVVDGAIRRQASFDLESLALLIGGRERLRAELEAELRRRKALGPKSCTCGRCIDRLSSPLREVQEEIDKIWSWWSVSLGTTPADVAAGRWP